MNGSPQISNGVPKQLQLAISGDSGGLDKSYKKDWTGFLASSQLLYFQLQLRKLTVQTVVGEGVVNSLDKITTLYFSTPVSPIQFEKNYKFDASIPTNAEIAFSNSS